MSRTQTIARLAAYNAWTGAMVARSQGKATAEQMALLAETCGKVPTAREATSAVNTMIRQGGF